MYQCTSCEAEIADSDVRWAFDEPYCDECFSESYNYCSRCDSVIYRSETHYNSDGDPYCSDCYDDDYDDDAPDNPEVYDSDRELIISLSRSWLQGKTETKRPIYINRKISFLRQSRIKSVWLIIRYISSVLSTEMNIRSLQRRIYTPWSRITCSLNKALPRSFLHLAAIASG